MRKTFLTGEQIKRDNGSGYRLSDAFPKRRFRNKVEYVVLWNGISLDASNVVSITLSR